MDNQDTLLGERIKASTARIEFARPALSPVLRRGRRRRSLVRTGQGVCALVLVMAVVLPIVALLPLNDTPISPMPASVPASWATATISDLGWTYRYPPDWRSQPLRFRTDGIGNTSGSVVSNAQLTFGHPDRPGFKTPKWDMRVLPPDGVAMAITAGGTALAAPSGISSVLTHPAPVKYSGDATSYQRVFVEGTSRIIVTAWIGPASSKDDRASLATVVGSIAGSSPGLGGLTPTHVTPALVSGSISYPPIVFPQVRDALKAHHILITGINATNLVIPPIIQAQALQRVLGPEANRYPLASATLVGFTDTVMRPVGSSGASGLTYNHKLAWLVISPNGGTDAIGTFNGKLQGPLLGTGVTFIDPINGKELLSTSVLTTATQTGVLGDGAVPVWRLTHDVNFGQFVGLFVPPESAQPATSASTILQETLGWYHPPAGAHLSLEFGDYEDGRQIGNLLGPRPVWVMDVTAACSAADPTSGPCPPEEVLILDAGSGHLLEALAFKH